jgi:fermentation-respiration switch protein FrsA (DUF1100 family)
MILEAVYPTVAKATTNRLRMRLGRVGDIVAPVLLAQLQPRLGVTAAQLRPIDHAAQLHCPVLVISGANDRHTTPQDTQSLYDRIESPKQLWLVPGTAHVDLYRASRQMYEQRVLSFLRGAMRD